MDHIRRFVFQHHRLLAAVCAGLAVLAGISAVRQTPEGVNVLIARHDLASGQVIDADDVRVKLLPSGPAHSLTESAAVGRRVAGPMRSGEPFTDYRVLRPDALKGYGTGAVLTSVLVSQVGGMTGIQVGDRIDVIAVDPHGESKAEVVARQVEVVTLSQAGDQDVPIGIVTTEKVALALAAAALESRFTVMQSS